jgi:ParB family chromosome partitioning protein
VATIRANPAQPRRDFRDAELEELAASISAHGLLQPILVRPAPDGFELVAGERRLRAVAKLGWQTVPAIVRPIEDLALLTIALVENLQRTDLNPIEEAEGYHQLISEYKLTQQQVAVAVAKDRSTIANALRLLQLPTTIRAMLVGGQLTMGHARALLAVTEDSARVELARQAVARGYTVRDLERLAKSTPAPISAGDEKRRGSQRLRVGPEHAAQLQQLTDAIRRHLQTDVRVESEDGVRGEIHVRFYSPDDLERILDRMVGASRGTS